MPSIIPNPLCTLIHLVLTDSRAKGLVYYVQLNKYKTNNLQADQLKKLLTQVRAGSLISEWAKLPEGRMVKLNEQEITRQYGSVEGENGCQRKRQPP